MHNKEPIPQTALKYDAEVLEEGHLELRVPLAAGARVTVFVIPKAGDDSRDLLEASESSLGFWDNQYDEEDLDESKPG